MRQRRCKFAVDLVLCDVGLPDGSGLDLKRQPRRQNDLPSIAITGYALDDQPDSFVKHLMKPVNFEVVQRTIHEVSER